MASSVRNVPRGTKNCLTQLDVSTVKNTKKTQLSGVERGAILKDYVWEHGNYPIEDILSQKSLQEI